MDREGLEGRFYEHCVAFFWKIPAEFLGLFLIVYCTDQSCSATLLDEFALFQLFSIKINLNKDNSSPKRSPQMVKITRI